MQATPSSDVSELMRRHHAMDAAILSDALLKPFRYGGEKEIWFADGIVMPTLNTLGPFGIMFQNITRKH